MLENLESWQIMFFLYVISSILNIWQLKLEDNNESPGLQKLLILLMIVTGILSLPVTLISLGINYFTVSRLNQKHDSEIISLRAAHSREIRAAEDSCDARIAQYDSLIHKDRERAYNDGHRAGVNEARAVYNRQYDYVRSSAYREGYADGQKDCSQGINLLEDLEK